MILTTHILPRRRTRPKGKVVLKSTGVSSVLVKSSYFGDCRKAKKKQKNKESKQKKIKISGSQKQYLEWLKTQVRKKRWLLTPGSSVCPLSSPSPFPQVSKAKLQEDALFGILFGDGIENGTHGLGKNFPDAFLEQSRALQILHGVDLLSQRGALLLRGGRQVLLL